MKKFLVDLHRLRHNPFNGLYHFSSQLAEHLILYINEDEKLYYYLPEDKKGLFGEKPEYITHRRWHKYYQPGTGKYDIWHLTTGISQYRPFSKKPKVVYTIHDVNFLIEDPGNLKRNNRTLKLMQRNCDQADHIVFISDYARKSSSSHLNFTGKPTSVIYNGVESIEYHGFEEPFYRPQKPFLLCLSLVQPRKNYHLLPPLLIGNDYELVIAGLNHFEYADKIRDEAKKWNVEDRVKLIGPVDEKSKYWYYKNCSAFLFPSLAEGFGIPPLEAMHFGKPVFLSRLTSLPEIGGEAAYYFDDFEPDSMRAVFNAGMQDFMANSRQGIIKQQLAKFDWKRAAQEYLSIYRSLT